MNNMPFRYQVMVPPGGVLHEGDDIAQAAAVFYAKMNSSLDQPQRQTVMLFEDGELVSMCNGNDFIQAD